MSPALAGILLALVGLAVPAQDRILLLGDRTFAAGDRVVHALDAMVAASGVVESSSFALMPGVAVTDEALIPLLEAQNAGELRAIVAVVGDLSLMHLIDPNATLPPPETQRSSRDVDEAGLTAAMDRLEACAQRLGVHLVFATTPLGIQGRVEAPELLPIAELVRAREPVLDLAAAFRDRESTPLFANGIDTLDSLGHEAVAREIFRQLCTDEAFLPARNDDERAARAAQRALDAWLASDDEQFEEAMGKALLYTPSTALGAARLAALHAARDGLEESCEHWAAIEPSTGPCEIPGITLARLLCQLEPASGPPCDPIEEEILAMWAQVLRRQPHMAWEQSKDLVALYPHRPEAWISQQIIAWATGHKSLDSANEYPASLSALTSAPIAEARFLEALDMGWDAATMLPVMLVAGAPYESLTPTGPILDTLRRTLWLGLRADGLNTWGKDTRQLLVPPAWHEEARRLAAEQED